MGEDGVSPATVWQLAWRNFLLYGAGMLAIFVCACLVAAAGVTLMSSNVTGWVKVLLLDGCLIVPVAVFVIVIRSQKRWSALPHSRWSRTKIIST